jgi:hypothetical protein
MSSEVSTESDPKGTVDSTNGTHNTSLNTEPNVWYSTRPYSDMWYALELIGKQGKINGKVPTAFVAVAVYFQTVQREVDYWNVWNHFCIVLYNLYGL